MELLDIVDNTIDEWLEESEEFEGKRTPLTVREWLADSVREKLGEIQGRFNTHKGFGMINPIRAQLALRRDEWMDFGTFAVAMGFAAYDATRIWHEEGFPKRRIGGVEKVRRREFDEWMRERVMTSNQSSVGKSNRCQ